jgi:hypothetical protein
MTSKLPDSLKAAIFVGGSGYDNKYQAASDGPEDGYKKLAQDVVDRYYRFGPETGTALTAEDREEHAKKARLKVEKEMDHFKKNKREAESAFEFSKLESKVKSYIKRQLKNEPRFEMDEDGKLVRTHENNKYRYNQFRNNRILPVDVSLTLDGISGIYFGNAFRVSKLPKSLEDKLLFQVKNVKHSVNNDTWTIGIDAICRITDSYDGVEPGPTAEGVKEKKKDTLSRIAAGMPKLYLTMGNLPDYIKAAGYTSIIDGYYTWDGEFLYANGEQILVDGDIITVAEAMTSGEPFLKGPGREFVQIDLNDNTYYYIDEDTKKRVNVSVYKGDEETNKHVFRQLYYLDEEDVEEYTALFEADEPSDEKEEIWMDWKKIQQLKGLQMDQMDWLTAWYNTFYTDMDQSEYYTITEFDVSHLLVDAYTTMTILQSTSFTRNKLRFKYIPTDEKIAGVPVFKWVWHLDDFPRKEGPIVDSDYGNEVNYDLQKSWKNTFKDLEDADWTGGYHAIRTTSIQPVFDENQTVYPSKFKALDKNGFDLTSFRQMPQLLTWEDFKSGDPKRILKKGLEWGMGGRNFYTEGNMWNPNKVITYLKKKDEWDNGTKTPVTGAKETDSGRMHPLPESLDHGILLFGKYWSDKRGNLVSQEKIIKSKDKHGKTSIFDAVQQKVYLDAQIVGSRFKGGTSTSEIEDILDILRTHKSAGTLLLFLQYWHLHMNWKYKDWKKGGYNGNIFRWIMWERENNSKIVNNLQLVAFQNLLANVYFWEFYPYAGGKGNTQHLPKSKAFVTMNKKPKKHIPWGPQGDSETGAYYKFYPKYEGFNPNELNIDFKEG